MPPSKRSTTTTLDTTAAKIGEPIRKAILDTDTGSFGVQIEPDYDPQAEIGALREQIATLREQLADAADAVKGGARRVIRQTEGTAKLYPVSTVAAVAAATAAFVLIVAGLRATPEPRHERMLDEMRDLYGRVRGRF